MTVVLEGINDKLGVMKEGLGTLESKMDRQFSDVGDRLVAVESKMDRQFSDVGDRLVAVESKMDRQFSSVGDRLVGVEGQLEFLKTEMALVRHRLIDPEVLKALEVRVAALERKIK